jgi:hypothetical protein
MKFDRLLMSIPESIDDLSGSLQAVNWDEIFGEIVAELLEDRSEDEKIILDLIIRKFGKSFSYLDLLNSKLFNIDQLSNMMNLYKSVASCSKLISEKDIAEAMEKGRKHREAAENFNQYRKFI